MGRVSNVEMGVKALKYRGDRLKEVGGPRKGEIGPKSSHVQSLTRLVAADGLVGSLAARGNVYVYCI